jgi:hypothetical protein
MAIRAAAFSIEILLSFLGVARLEIFGLHGAPTSGVGFHFVFLGVNERHDSCQIGIRKIEWRHSLVDAPRTDYRPDFVSVDVFFHEFGAGQVRPGFAAGSIAPVAERTLRSEKRLSFLHLLRGGSLLLG